jgi:hypothetical protein
MEIVEQAQKGGLMNIKENYYIFKFERRKELIEEQQKNKKGKGKENQSFLFDIVIKADDYTQRNDIGDRRIYKQTTHPIEKAVPCGTDYNEAAQHTQQKGRTETQQAQST